MYRKKSVIAIWLAVILTLGYNVMAHRPLETKTVAFEEFKNRAAAGELFNLSVQDRELIGEAQNSSGRRIRYKAVPAHEADILEVIRTGRSIKVSGKQHGTFMTIVTNAVPFVILMAFWFYMVKNMRKAENASKKENATSSVQDTNNIIH